jgi:oligosaccharyltransferase complex subunit epsilon
MPPKKSATPQPSTPKSITTSSHQHQKSQSKPAPVPTSIRNTQDAQQIAQGVWNNYVEKTPQRVKLIDAFMLFLIIVGALQFGYCVLAGNYVSAPKRRGP